MGNRIIGKRRPVTSVPHAGNQAALIQTGIGFDGNQICLLVPPGIDAPAAVRRFVIDFVAKVQLPGGV